LTVCCCSTNRPRLLNAAKAGHTGTLDPMATGLLPLCFGEATKFAGELLDADKSYRATLKLGVTTDTADAEGRVLIIRQVGVTEEQWRAATADFQGETEQVPPMHSALKRDGRPLYEYARAGIEVEREPRHVTIQRIETISFRGDEATIDVDCSKGTYIRTLAADIGERLGCGAHLTALRRTCIGTLTLAGAASLDRLEALTLAERDDCLAPPDALLAGVPEARLDERQMEQIVHGQRIPWRGETGQRYRLYGSGVFLGVGELTSDGWLNPKRLVASEIGEKR